MRQRKRVDISVMTPQELRRYKKTLAYVRKYTRDRREWQRALKAGATKAKTLQAYRETKYGRADAAASEKIVRDASKEKFPQENGENLIGKLERLLASLKQTEAQRSALIKELHDIKGD